MEMGFPILSIITLTPFAAGVLLLLFPAERKREIRITALAAASLTLILSVVAYVSYDMEKAGYTLLELGAQTALVKGGHLSEKMVHDILVTNDGVEAFVAPRPNTRHTHGTGCTLASAIATGIAQGMVPRDAVARAEAYVHEAIRRAPSLGQGHGPIGHAHTVRPFHAD